MATKSDINCTFMLTKNIPGSVNKSGEQRRYKFEGLYEYLFVFCCPRISISRRHLCNHIHNARSAVLGIRIGANLVPLESPHYKDGQTTACVCVHSTIRGRLPDQTCKIQAVLLSSYSCIVRSRDRDTALAIISADEKRTRRADWPTDEID